MNTSSALTILLLIGTLQFAYGLQCYNCKYNVINGTESGVRTCHEDPAQSKVETCPTDTGKEQYCWKFFANVTEPLPVLNIIRGCSPLPTGFENNACKGQTVGQVNGTSCFCKDEKCNNESHYSGAMGLQAFGLLLPILTSIVYFTS